MKNILATTDFSKTANNAAAYAVELAQNVNASVTLFHCFHLPVMTGEGPVVTTIPFEDLEKDSLESLNELKKELNQNYPDVKITVVSKAGFATDEIVDYSAANKPDIIVMGIKGSGKLDQLLGSVSTFVSKKSKNPVLIIPADSKFEKVNHIVMAFDLKEIKNPESIDIVLELAIQFNSKITALNISRHNHTGSEQNLSAGQVNTILGEVPHNLVSIANDDIINGIDNYLNSNKIQLLVMIKRKHDVIDSLLHGSNTRKMAFHTHVPLLVLHEN